MKLAVSILRLTTFSKVLLFTVVIAFGFQSFPLSALDFFDESDILKINPDYKIKRYSDGNVVVYSSLEDGEKIVHNFTDFNADILLAALRKQKVDNVIFVLSRKYSLSEDECRRKVKHSINVLAEWDIIIGGDKFLTNR